MLLYREVEAQNLLCALVIRDKSRVLATPFPMLSASQSLCVKEGRGRVRV